MPTLLSYKVAGVTPPPQVHPLSPSTATHCCFSAVTHKQKLWKLFFIRDYLKGYNDISTVSHSGPLPTLMTPLVSYIMYNKWWPVVRAHCSQSSEPMDVLWTAAQIHIHFDLNFPWRKYVSGVYNNLDTLIFGFGHLALSANTDIHIDCTRLRETGFARHHGHLLMLLSHPLSSWTDQGSDKLFLSDCIEVIGDAPSCLCDRGLPESVSC